MLPLALLRNLIVIAIVMDAHGSVEGRDLGRGESSHEPATDPIPRSACACHVMSCPSGAGFLGSRLGVAALRAVGLLHVLGLRGPHTGMHSSASFFFSSRNVPMGLGRDPSSIARFGVHVALCCGVRLLFLS
jgi:hypothetical protein